MKGHQTYIIFSATYYPNLGGVESFTKNLSQYLTKLGYKTVIVTSNIYKLCWHEYIDNVEIFRFSCFNTLNNRNPIPIINPIFFKIFKELISIKHGNVIINTRFYLHSLLGVVYAKLKRFPSIIIEHGTNHIVLSNYFLNLIGQIYEHLLSYFLFLFCKDYYGVSEACNNWLKHFRIKAKGTIYNAVDISSINKALLSSTIDIRQKYNLSSDSFIVTYAGRLLEEKGILKLIRAIIKLNETDQKIYLFIAGSGNLYDVVKNYANKNIIVLGQVYFHEVVTLLKYSDVFCLPSDYPEGFSTSIIEAAACNCFVITTNVGGSKELFINHRYGVILKENNEKEICESVLFVKNNNDYRNEAVKLAHQRVLENFTWDIVVKRVVGIFKNEN